MYLDSAYIAKFYVNEPGADKVRALIRQASFICTSAWALLEVTCVFHRHVRERSLTEAEGRELIDLFRSHAKSSIWDLIPLTDALLQKTVILVRGLPPDVPLRSGDAIHLATAIEAGETEIWSNDRHLLAAARHFDILGKSV